MSTQLYAFGNTISFNFERYCEFCNLSDNNVQKKKKKKSLPKHHLNQEFFSAKCSLTFPFEEIIV